MPTEHKLTAMFNIQYPIILAPMFLVSNVAMTKAAIDAGITAAIPALNYRTGEEFRQALKYLTEINIRPFGINLIVNKSNVHLRKQLKLCIDYNVDYIITSLGSPKAVIDACKPTKIKVFCDVTDLAYAKKVEYLGSDGLIAVNNQAGGHAGPHPPEKLIPELRNNCNLPIISAGGVSNTKQLNEILNLGAAGASVGSLFIASKESPVSDEYKQACINYGAKDVVFTTKLSGTPCTVINTPYVQKTGTRQNWAEKLMNKNKRFKKWAKAFLFLRGMKSLQKAAFSHTYKTVWCAGPSIEYVKRIRPVKAIVGDLVDNLDQIYK